ncbi:MAG: dual specificity protein phosphatase [Ignavibacteria bacterium]
MSEVRICGVTEVPSFIEQYQIKKLLSCLSKYELYDKMYGFTQSVIDLNPTYWKDPNNWMRLNMDDVSRPNLEDAPNMEEIVKGITFGASAIKAGQNLLVHCQLGLSRSPAMAIGSLLGAGETIEGAYTRVKQVRPRINPNPLIITLIDEYLKLNGELVKYNDEFRGNNRKELGIEYNKLMESHLHDSKTLGIIFEQMEELNRL